MARERSVAPARPRRRPTLLVSVMLPIALMAAVVAVAAAVVATGGGRRAANKELDARAATVKKAWDAAGRPSRDAPLAALGKRLNAHLRLTRGSKLAAGVTSGDTRAYAFPAHGKRTLHVALTVKQSKDALSSGLSAGIVIALAGLAVLLFLGSAIVRALAGGPLRALAATIQRLNAGDHAARAELKGSDEVRAVADAFNHVAERSAQMHAAAGTDTVTGLPTADGVRETVEVEIKRAARDMIPMALVLVDLDNFKAVNDAHGKQAGDQVL